MQLLYLYFNLYFTYFYFYYQPVTTMADKTRSAREKKETASLIQAVMTDILHDEKFMQLVSAHVDSSLAKFQKQIDEQAAMILHLQDASTERERKLEESIGRQEARILDLEISEERNKKEIKLLKESHDGTGQQFSLLRRDVNSQDQYNRRNSLRFFGIREVEGVTSDELIVDLVNTSLGVHLQKGDIDHVQRVNSSVKTTGPSPSTMIVKFLSFRKRNEVLGSRRKLAGTRKSIQEDLTRDNAKLLKMTRDHQRVKTAWTRDGRVIALLPATDGKEIKKTIFSEADLARL